MLTQRLAARCPGARPIGVARADNFSIGFSKRAKDGSGKAMLDEGASHAPGVLFDVPMNERSVLDRAEGPGYRRYDAFEVTLAADGVRIRASTYLASPDAIDRSLQPYDWYHALVLAGARQHALPQSHIETLEAVAALADPRPARETRLHALKVISCAGF